MTALSESRMRLTQIKSIIESATIFLVTRSVVPGEVSSLLENPTLISPFVLSLLSPVYLSSVDLNSTDILSDNLPKAYIARNDWIPIRTTPTNDTVNLIDLVYGTEAGARIRGVSGSDGERVPGQSYFHSCLYVSDRGNASYPGAL